MSRNLEPKEVDIFSGCCNGSLDVAVIHSRDNWDEVSRGGCWDESKGDSWIDVCINVEDLEAISLDIFQISTRKPYAGKDNILVGRNRNRGLFQQSFPEYPMLGKIDCIFGGDIFFNPEEVEKLREECIRMKSIISNPSTDLALRKLLYSCDIAREKGLSLALLCS